MIASTFQLDVDAPKGMTWVFEPTATGGRLLLRENGHVPRSGRVLDHLIVQEEAVATVFVDGMTVWVNGQRSEANPVSPPLMPRLTSVVILSGDNLDYLTPCLTSLATHLTVDEPIEVVLVTNAKLPATTTHLRDGRWPFRMHILHRQERFSFAAFNNFGAAQARGQYLCFLNDDTTVEAGWLREMLMLMEADPMVGIVGNRLVGFDDRLQHCGIALKQPGEYYCLHPFHGQAADTPSAMVDRVTDAVTGACLCIRRTLFETLGGFDEQFERGYYEDTDLCLRAKQVGWRTIYAHKSVVRHKGSVSFGRERDMSGIWLANTVKFKERWDAVIENNLHTFQSPKFRYRPKTMLLQDNFLSTAGGGERTIATLARHYAARYQAILYTSTESTAVKSLIAERLGLDLYAVPLVTSYPTTPPHVFMNGEWASDVTGKGVERNIYWVMFPHMIGRTHVSDWLNTYDTIIANSTFTQSHILDRWHRESLVIHPPACLFGCDDLTAKTQSIVSIGRFFPAEHSKKQDVLVEGFQEGGLAQKGWTLHLCGSVRSENSHHLQYLKAVQTKAGRDLDRSIFFHVNCSLEEVMTVTRHASVFWHATGYKETDPGAWEHFGIATVEAMSAGCWPVVIGQGGQAEIVGERYGVTWNTLEELIKQTQMFWDLSPRERQLVQQDVMARAEMFSEARFIERLQELDL
jgi:GT2 family glycosyltransferase